MAGTSIGGGMLALPILTGIAGFIPSMFIYLACWLFMACTGLLFLEIALGMEEGTNIISMAQKTLGGWGKAAAWGLYLFLFYSLTLAYIVGSGGLIVEVFSSGSIHLNPWQGQLLFLILFVPIVYAGAHLVGRVNLALMFGLGISYIVFVVLGFPHVDTSLLERSEWPFILGALPITFTAFAYQGVVPTLVSYMHRDVRSLRLAIILGSFLPLITYVIWQWLILGIIPVEGPYGLKEAMAQGQNAVQPLKYFLNTPTVYIVGQYFAFFALVTSFLGVTLGLMDFLADGIGIKKTAKGKMLLCGLVFLPPLVVALFYPHVFLIALDYAGGIGCALLLGLLPVLMAWRGRYYLHMESDYRLQGGRFLLAILILFIIIELISELASRLGVVTP